MSKRVSLKAIILGGISDIVATNILVVPLLVYVMHDLMKTETSSAQLSTDAGLLLQSNMTYFTIAMILGGVGSIIGGYVAAWIADHDEILNGVLASFLCLATGIYAIVWGHDSAPLWQHVMALVTAPILTGFGGYLRTRI